MRELIFLGVFISFISCKLEAVKKETDKFNVTYNENIETYFLAELLSIDHRTTNKQWEKYKLKTCKEYQPIVSKALLEFKDLVNHEIAIETAKLNDTLISLGYGTDLMMEVLLHQSDFKLLKGISSFESRFYQLEGDIKIRLENIISNYLKLLYSFYQTENIGLFFMKNANFYNGAVNEVKSHIPKGFTDAIETYYGDSREKYIVLVSPMMIWPIEENEGRGIGPTLEKNNKKIVFEIMSPYVQVPVKLKEKNYRNFGFDYRPRARMLTIHEFGHSFVNSELVPYKKQIDRYSYLFTDNLKKRMESKGIPNWNTFVIESFVRLGEIRVAQIQNDRKRANHLRNYHTNLEFFIFLPQLEEKIIEFENNRDKYPMWKDFIPELLKVFEKNTIDFVNEKLE